MLAEAVVLIPKSANKGTEIQMDVLPLVLCKDCKNLGYTNSHWFCKWLNRCVDEDWFCADGERRTDDA